MKKRITSADVLEYLQGVAHDLRQEIYGLKFTMQQEFAWQREQLKQHAVQISNLKTSVLRLCERRADMNGRVSKLERDMRMVKRMVDA